MPLMAVASTSMIAAGVPRLTMFRCQSSSTPPVAQLATGENNDGLHVGSPVVIVEAPPTLKTAVPMPSLKLNNGHVRPGDVGRIVSRKPKDVWAVRLAIGTYLIDGKHFRPLDLDKNITEAA